MHPTNTRFHERYTELFTEEELASFKNTLSETDTPLWKYWEDFLEEWGLSGRSQDTVANVYSALRILALYGGLTSIEVWKNKRFIFQIFHKLQREKKWSACTFNTYRKNVGTYFRFLIRRGLINENPVKSIEKMKEYRNNYPIPDAEELGQFRQYLETYEGATKMIRKRNLLFFSIILTTGMRPAEALGMSLKNIADRESLCIQGIKLGGKPRAYPMEDWVKALWIDYSREVVALGRDKELERNLFLGFSIGEKWSYCGVRKFLDRANVVMGLKNRITCYSFRRKCATSLFQNGLQLEKIAQYLGHTRLSTTMRYIQGLPGVNAEAYAMMSATVGKDFAYSPAMTS